MNNDKLDASEKRFWQGTSTREEEHLLKMEADNPYFTAVKDAAEEKMDWSFEDFVQKTENLEEEAKIVKGNFPFQKLLWIAAVVATAILIVWKWNPTPKENSPVAKSENGIDVPANAQDTSNPKTNTQLVLIDENKQSKSKPAITKIASNTSGIRHRKAVNPTSIVAAVPETDTLDAYEPQFVLVNGKPVYNEAEAVTLTKQSLALLADNISKGASHLSVVKDLSIHF
ncbi:MULTISPECIES: hypothetical protein [Chitinophagaceae]